ITEADTRLRELSFRHMSLKDASSRTRRQVLISQSTQRLTCRRIFMHNHRNCTSHLPRVLVSEDVSATENSSYAHIKCCVDALEIVSWSLHLSSTGQQYRYLDRRNRVFHVFFATRPMCLHNVSSELLRE